MDISLAGQNFTEELTSLNCENLQKSNFRKLLQKNLLFTIR